MTSLASRICILGPVLRVHINCPLCQPGRSEVTVAISSEGSKLHQLTATASNRSPRTPARLPRHRTICQSIMPRAVRRAS